MSPKPSPQPTIFVPLLVIGIALNTLGIVLTSLGSLRYLFMVLGLALMLIAVLKMLQSRPGDDKSPPPS